MDFDHTDIYKKKLRPAISEVEALCTTWKIPMFMAFCIQNNAEGSEYKNFINGSVSNGLDLADDKILEYERVAGGLSTTMKQDFLEIQTVPPNELELFRLNKPDTYQISSFYREPYTVKKLEAFDLTWEIMNTGETIWNGRNLVLKNAEDIPLFPRHEVIHIQKTMPGERQRIQMFCKAGTKKGTFRMNWIMLDENCCACFSDNIPFEKNITVK